jgi:hypothetical protein
MAKTKPSRRKYLTTQQLEMTCTELMGHLRCSKATAWRAKRRGFYCPGYNGSSKVRDQQRFAKSQIKPLRQSPKPGTRITLSQLERKLSRNALAQRYGIGHALASAALKAGEFTMPGS